MKKYEAILYGWRNVENGKMYIGYHKTTDVDDGYIFSTEDEEAHLAWSYGKLERTIIHRGKQSVCITLENYILKKEQAHKNPMFYNKSVGGGVGCVKDFSNLTKSVMKLAEEWVAGKVVTRQTSSSHVDKDEIKALADDIRNGRYKTLHNERVSSIYALPRNQVRFNVVDNDHVSDIADKMRDNPAKARQNISPVIVMVDGNHREIIDGNHTIGAAKDAGWVEVPVIYINASEFKNKQANVDYFGYCMNHQEKLKKPNDNQDLKRAIVNFSNTHTDYVLGTEDFKDAFKQAYGEFWTNKQISQSMVSVKKMLETEEQIKKNNFKVYSHRELMNKVKELEIENPGTAVISITSGSCFNAGIGAVLNKAGGLDTWNGIMLITHRNMHEYQTYKQSKAKLKAAMQRVHSKMKIDIVELPSFVNTK